MLDLSVNADVHIGRHYDRLFEEATKKLDSLYKPNLKTLTIEGMDALIKQGLKDFWEEYRSRGIEAIDAVLEGDQEAEDLSEPKLTSEKESQKSKKSRAHP